jgi:hypothetical protein
MVQFETSAARLGKDRGIKKGSLSRASSEGQNSAGKTQEDGQRAARRRMVCESGDSAAWKGQVGNNPARSANGAYLDL